jgi:hypothetical protein
MARSRFRAGALAVLAAAAILAGSAGGLLAACGPFTDVTDAAFCPFVLEIFTLGITTGTTPTTYDGPGLVSRLQMAAFLSRTVDAVVKRGSPRTALNRHWAPKSASVLDITTLGSGLRHPAFDGLDVWVPNNGAGTVSRVRASDGSLLATWTAPDAFAALTAAGKVFVTGESSPGRLYRIDPRLPAGAAAVVASNLGETAVGLAFDGVRFWVPGFQGTVSLVTPTASVPWTVTTVTAGFVNPLGAVFDGSNVWVANYGGGTLVKLDSSGAVLQTVTVGGGLANGPYFPTFDGSNIWSPNFSSNSVSVVRRSNGAVLATLTGNGLLGPFAAAFDGERVLVTNNSGDSVSLFKAADLTPIGTQGTGASSLPRGACSDGANFWITLRDNQLARF